MQDRSTPAKALDTVLGACPDGLSDQTLGQDKAPDLVGFQDDSEAGVIGCVDIWMMRLGFLQQHFTNPELHICRPCPSWLCNQESWRCKQLLATFRKADLTSSVEAERSRPKTSYNPSAAAVLNA